MRVTMCFPQTVEVAANALRDAYGLRCSDSDGIPKCQRVTQRDGIDVRASVRFRTDVLDEARYVAVELATSTRGPGGPDRERAGRLLHEAFVGNAAPLLLGEDADARSVLKEVERQAANCTATHPRPDAHTPVRGYVVMCKRPQSITLTDGDRATTWFWSVTIEAVVLTD